MVPVPQLMGERKPAAVRRASAVDRDHRLPLRAHDGRLAAIERAIVDYRAARPGDGLQVDLAGGFDTQALENALRGRERGHSSSGSSASSRASRARSSSIPCPPLSDSPLPFRAAIIMSDAFAPSPARISPSFLRTASLSSAETSAGLALNVRTARFARSRLLFAA